MPTYSKNWKPVPYSRTEREEMAAWDAMERQDVASQEAEESAHKERNTLTWTLQNGQIAHIHPVTDRWGDLSYEYWVGDGAPSVADMESVRHHPIIVAKVGCLGLTAERKAALLKMKAL